MSWQESPWTPEQRALLLASRRENIGPHGIPMHEALDENNRDRFGVKVQRDYAQMAVNRVRKDFEKRYAHDDISALMFHAELADPDG